MITFQASGVPAIHRDRDRLRRWLRAVARDHGRRIGDLNYVLMSDEDLRALNIRFLRHRDYTDVLSFDGSAGDEAVAGDILMSLDRIRENARTFGVSTQHELRRVMVHGLLHLLGHSDKTAALRKAMRAQEDKYLARY